MSGHSKWAKVKYQKAVKDPKRGKAFSKLAALITVAAREGGDINSNPKLRVAVNKAKEIGIDWWETDSYFSSKAKDKELAASNSRQVEGAVMEKEKKIKGDIAKQLEAKKKKINK